MKKKIMDAPRRGACTGHVRQAAFSKEYEAKKATHADALVTKYYTQEMLDMVAEMFRQDLTSFGYQELSLDA